jgi:hypothetical protein
VILLAVFWLGVLMVVAFTAWRLLANIRALLATVQAMGERLAPALAELQAASEDAAEHAGRLQARGARAAGDRAEPTAQA